MKEEQHMKIITAVMKYYYIPLSDILCYRSSDEYLILEALYQMKEAVKKSRSFEMAYIKNMGHHGEFNRERRLLNELEKIIADFNRGDRDGRVVALTNMIKLLHMIQDACVLQSHEGGPIFDVKTEWLGEGELLGKCVEVDWHYRAQALLTRLYSRLWIEEGVRAATIISSALMRIFLDATGFQDD